MRRIIYTIPRELIGFVSGRSIGLLMLASILSVAASMMRANTSSVIDSYLLWAWGGMSQNMDIFQLSIWLITGLSFAIPYGHWLETDIATRSNTLYIKISRLRISCCNIYHAILFDQFCDDLCIRLISDWRDGVWHTRRAIHS